MNFEFLGTFNIFKCEIFQKSNIQSCSNGQNGSFWGSKMTKIDFTQNLNGRKSRHFHIVHSQLGCQVCKFYSHGFPGEWHKSIATLCGKSSVWTTTCHLPVESLAQPSKSRKKLIIFLSAVCLHFHNIPLCSRNFHNVKLRLYFVDN